MSSNKILFKNLLLWRWGAEVADQTTHTVPLTTDSCKDLPPYQGHTTRSRITVDAKSGEISQICDEDGQSSIQDENTYSTVHDLQGKLVVPGKLLKISSFCITNLL
jgi:hypothetical protein